MSDMTIKQAASKWNLSQNWVRALITSGRLTAKLVGGPVKYYAIPAGTPKPPSMQRSPARLGSKKKIKPESIARREYRAAQKKDSARITRVRKAVKKASAKVKATKTA